jgi:hypothetical protein
MVNAVATEPQLAANLLRYRFALATDCRGEDIVLQLAAPDLTKRKFASNNQIDGRGLIKKEEVEINMKLFLGALPAIALVSALSFMSLPAAACNQRGNCPNAPGQNKDPVSAPAPLVGAGLPGLAIGLGYGAYWLTRRRRNAG